MQTTKLPSIPEIHDKIGLESAHQKLTVRLASGIGNNLYQIAVLYHVSTCAKRKWSVVFANKNAPLQETRPFGGHYTTLIDGLPDCVEDIFQNVKWESSTDPDAQLIPSYVFALENFWESRDNLKKLFTPNKNILNYIDKKYSHIFEKQTIGIHLRFISGSDSFHPEQNVKEWVEDILLQNIENFENIVVLSNRPQFAKLFLNNFSTSHNSKNIYFIEDEPNFIDLFILTRSNIIITSNSTFGFWGGALSNASSIYIPPTYRPGLCPTCIPNEWETNKKVFEKYYEEMPHIFYN